MAVQRRKLLVLRCMAFPEVNEGRRGYAAICIDLSVTAWRPTFREAKRSLYDAMQGYIETAVETATKEELKNWEKVVLRPVPLWPYRMQYTFFSLIENLPKLPKSDNAHVFSREFPRPVG